MLSVIALGGLGEGGEAAVTGSIRAALGDPPPVLCRVCQQSLRAPFHQAELGDRRRLCPNSSCCEWDDFLEVILVMRLDKGEWLWTDRGWG